MLAGKREDLSHADTVTGSLCADRAVHTSNRGRIQTVFRPTTTDSLDALNIMTINESEACLFLRSPRQTDKQVRLGLVTQEIDMF